MGLGCTALAGIDHEYVAAGPDAASVGGAGGDEGGTSGSGGISGASGSGGSTTAGSGGAEAGACEQGQKFCGSACVTPSVENGCALSGCERCPDPTVPHSTVVCLGTACAGDCEPGYVPSQGQCVQATGGTGGSAGMGGTAGTAGAGDAGQSDSGACNPADCPDCIGLRCCTGLGRCGCQHGVPPIVNPYCIGL